MFKFTNPQHFLDYLMNSPELHKCVHIVLEGQTSSIPLEKCIDSLEVNGSLLSSKGKVYLDNTVYNYDFSSCVEKFIFMIDKDKSFNSNSEINEFYKQKELTLEEFVSYFKGGNKDLADLDKISELVSIIDYIEFSLNPNDRKSFFLKVFLNSSPDIEILTKISINGSNATKEVEEYFYSHNKISNLWKIFVPFYLNKYFENRTEALNELEQYNIT